VINFLIKYKMMNFLVVLITILALALPACADIIFSDSYESYPLEKNIFTSGYPDRWKSNIGTSYKYHEVVNSPVRAGSNEAGKQIPA